jgi:hypothetical protein
MQYPPVFSADAVVKDMEARLLERLLGNRVTTASEFANGFSGAQTEHVTLLVKERLSDVVVCHPMAGDLGTLLFLKTAAPEEMLHRVYVGGQKAAKNAERAIEALGRECKEAHRKLKENKGSLENSAERMNELLREEVKRIRAEHKKDNE